MTITKLKSYKVDFFAVTLKEPTHHTAVLELLGAGKQTHAMPLDGGDEEHFQIKSIVRLPGGGQAFKAVFGRCRFGEKPVQGALDGREEDVVLKPGHGLVDKNYFMFYGRRNMIAWQRSGSSGSHFSKLQRYLKLATGVELQVSPVLTSDSYARLLGGAQAKTLELSFAQPRDPSFYVDTSVADAVKLVQRFGGVSCKIRIGVSRTNKRLVDKAKDAAVMLAKHGLARVARVTLDDDAMPIDLIADRVVETIQVPIYLNGRPAAEEVYAALESARDARQDDLDRFFGT